MTLAPNASRRQSREAVYKKLQERFVGKSGQLVVVAYTDSVDEKKYFRFGRLESDQLIYEEPAGFLTEVRLPISEFFAFEQGSWKVLTGLPEEEGYPGDIFGKHHGLNHNPPSLDDYIYFERPQIELYIGEEEANHYFRTVEGTELEPSDWMKDFLKNGPDERFLSTDPPPPGY